MGGFQVEGGAISHDWFSGVTSFDSIQTGPMAFDNDAGILSWMDMPSSTTTAGIVLSYNAQLDSVSVLTIYSTTTSSGVVTYGAVGIGTTTPTTEAALSVAGGIFASFPQAATTSGLCQSGADIDAATATNSGGRHIVVCSAAPGDIAEWYETEAGTEPADIVAVSASTIRYEAMGVDARSGQLTGTTTPQTISILKRAAAGDAIIGVVSTAPYQNFGRAIIASSANPQPIALVGRVPVKVNLEGGPIKTGDRIVLSSVSGVGAKATTSSQTIGVALEPFGDERETASSTPKTGKILVFINLGYLKLDSAAVEAMSNPANTTNAWNVDQQSGKISVNFFGDINLNGNNIINVSNVIGMFGKWQIDENGKLAAKEVETETLVVKQAATLGSSEKRIGVTIYDEDTGEPYCLKMKGGQMVSVPGVCGASQPITNNQQSTTDTQPASSPTPPSPPEEPPPSSETPTAGAIEEPPPAPEPASEPAPEPELSPEPAPDSTPPPVEPAPAS